MHLVRPVCIAALLLALLASPCAAKPTRFLKANTTRGTDNPIILKYAGGPGGVVSSVRIISVYWGSSPRLRPAIDNFYRAIAPSSYVGWLMEYHTPFQRITPGAFVGSHVIEEPPAPQHSKTAGGKVVTDAMIGDTLAAEIRSSALPSNTDGNVLFMIHFPPGLTVQKEPGSLSCRDFCGYHSSVIIDGVATIYAVIPDMGGECLGCGGVTSELASTTVVASHEIAEAITDPLPGALGWYTADGDEIADICGDLSGRVGRWLVSKLWSNRRQACVLNGPQRVAAILRG